MVSASQAQRAVALQLRGRASNPGSHLKVSHVAAILIESDIVYPAGAGTEYGDKFYAPYREFLDGAPPVPDVPSRETTYRTHLLTRSAS